MSYETKHTPGPWIYQYTQGHGFEILLPNGDKIGDAVTRGGGESEANARLMASAPDLLAALGGLLSSRCFRNDLTPEHHVALDKARASIAKATKP